jgi:hypothetical protein
MHSTRQPVHTTRLSIAIVGRHWPCAAGSFFAENTTSGYDGVLALHYSIIIPDPGNACAPEYGQVRAAYACHVVSK